jgi:EAL domain-containing protein (putative c-di-GMP-specific phosphodiesterase class I)
LRQACTQMKRWHTQFVCDPPLAISVNLSPSQFAQPNLVEQIAEVLKETRIEPSSLRLEITESVLMDDHEIARDVLARLKLLGVGLKIDDFGTGYSSLSYLSQLPFDTMKIDRSFTMQLQGGDCNSAIVKTILDMAHTLGMQVVAEGVEQNEQITHLISMGCEFGQGFFFSKAVSAQEAERMVESMMDPPDVTRALLSAVPPFVGTQDSTCA